MYDLVLKNPTQIDPASGIHEVRDIGIKGGQITANKANILREKSKNVINLSGKVVIPGIIDSHAHFSMPKDAIGHKMMAKAGITTAIDFSAKPDQLIGSLKKSGAGLNVGGIFPLVPSDTLSNQDPSSEELKSIIRKSVRAGSLGVKLLGGHYPLSPEATGKAIDIANDLGVYVASHIGTTATGSNLEGLREIPDLIQDNNLHIAHVNSYCRGFFKNASKEALEAIEIIQRLDEKVVSESYLGTINGTSGKFKDGEFESEVTKNCLKMENYSVNKEGLKNAIMDGYASVVENKGDRKQLVGGKEGIVVWKKANSNVPISFSVNSPQATFLLATTKNKDGEFVIDAISTDGGAYPRNHIVGRGLALVRYDALSLEEFVEKASTAPAQMFGLKNKGELTEGSDGDVTVLDLSKGKAVMSMVGGRVIMVQGVVVGQGGTLLTTKKVAKKNIGPSLSLEQVDIKNSLFHS